ncbi:phospholipid methyltransferase [Synechococcus sp. MEDNS5]|uniref:methyltransferase family protein n=1 Tax=Synechococcus sp. MEDNS5 TaxID=1442554 RepID=UPI000B6674C9|nr:isoprenylcysteine carboxylmethyltransferase family protein [Synechococcus sp. MEDNS5]OUX71079.1 MAG: S-isoprenylcysteine methyltransferase [Synechococcus sp. TMED90]QNJ05916.1 phospholipid methyltransferase [Synechococcus sp. MEDNS5]|tara:strand:- start:2450 stop:2998 length:549 start_codon:yes stop_codon:yes gene_type:complete
MADWNRAFQGWNLSWRSLFSNQQGEWWLVAQLLLIVGHLAPAWPSTDSLGVHWPPVVTMGGLILFAVGLGLAVQGFRALGPSLSPLPEPKKGAALVTTGVYAHCRHPLYRAVLVCSLGVALAWGSLLHLALLLSLVVVLTGKAHREERELLKCCPNYADYMKTTASIVAHIPGLDWRTTGAG